MNVLDTLRIQELNMKYIWDRRLPEQSFCQLRHLDVDHCEQMVILFPFDMLPRLQNLEELKIDDCSQLTCDFAYNEEGSASSSSSSSSSPSSSSSEAGFPRLRRMSLQDLGSLTHVGLNRGNLAYRDLRTLFISGCDRLRNAFSYFTATTLVQFKELTVEFCDEMEEIVTTGEGGVENMNTIVFPHLETLKLKNLPNLKGFCSSGFEVMNCGHDNPQQTLFNDKVAFPCLDELHIAGLSSLENIWGITPQTNSFRKLKKLEIFTLGWEKLVDAKESNFRDRFKTLQECAVTDEEW